MSSSATPPALSDWMPEVRKPVIASASPVISMVSRNCGVTDIHSMPLSSIPVAWTKAGKSCRPASNSGAARIRPSRSDGSVMPVPASVIAASGEASTITATAMRSLSGFSALNLIVGLMSAMPIS